MGKKPLSRALGECPDSRKWLRRLQGREETHSKVYLGNRESGEFVCEVLGGG